MFNIVKLDNLKKAEHQAIIDQKTKPLGSLGELENLALQLALIIGKIDNSKNLSISISNPTMLVFAGDHGIASENVSIAPSEVTQQMVLNFLSGGAAINCFCRSQGMAIDIIDAGILIPIDNPELVQQSVGRGTKNFKCANAMTEKQVLQSLSFGRSVTEKHLAKNCNVFGFGEMGIANTSSASAILALLSQTEVESCIGRGTGVDDKTFKHKLAVLKEAVQFHRQALGKNSDSPMSVMAAVAGFEIVQMVGAMLTVAENKKIILVDGFIATAAALLAVKLYPDCRDYMIFCHRSNEQGHKMMLSMLNATPLLDLGLRLGEGTGAALAFPIIKAAAGFYNEMASFESAGVTAV